MPKIKDMTGQTFGRLTVLRLDAENHKKGAYWICRCECGNIVSVNGSALRSGNTRSCGCLREEMEDIAGRRFGKLTAIYRDKSKTDGSYWLCRCDCGNITSVKRKYLINGDTKSCGCLRSEQSDLTGQRFGSLTALHKDEEDPTGQGRNWICRCDCGNEVSASASALTSGRIRSCGCMKKDLIDLTGQTFGMLTVLSRDDERHNEGHTYWLCRCKCGNIVSVEGSKLRNGLTKSCGCLKRRKGKANPRTEDLRGQKFGKLTPLHLDPGHEGKRAYWVCKCDCGNTVTVSEKLLRAGKTRSCGCMRLSDMRQSYGEINIKRYLDEHGLKENEDYKRQVKFDDLIGSGGGRLSYDFEVFHPLHCFIEFQGKQHYVPVKRFGGTKCFNAQVANDKIKERYAANLRVPLICIAYQNGSYDDVRDAMDEVFNT